MLLELFDVADVGQDVRDADRLAELRFDQPGSLEALERLRKLPPVPPGPVLAAIEVLEIGLTVPGGGSSGLG